MRSALILAVALVGCRRAPAVVANTAPAGRPARGCPTAAAVFGPVQQGDGDTWQLWFGDGSLREPGLEPPRPRRHLAGDPLPANHTWLIRQTAPPCPLRVIKVEPSPYSDEVTLEGHCDEPESDDRSAAEGDWHPPIVVTADPGGCRLIRPVEIGEDEVAGTELPGPVKRAFDLATAEPGRDVSLRIISAGTVAAVWQIDSVDHEAMNQGDDRVNCPHPILVFVRTPRGIAQLDVSQAVNGLLVDGRGPRVVMTGAFGSPHNGAFDVGSLPPHRSTASSTSYEACPPH